MKVALILPVEYSGGTFRLFLNLIRYFASHSELELVVGIPDDYINSVKVNLDKVQQRIFKLRSSWFQLEDSCRERSGRHPTSPWCGCSPVHK